jgi:large subunit ribosomal protein L25
MSSTGILNAQSRDAKGTANARRFRHQGQLPGVIYGEGGEASMVSLSEHDLEKELRRHASENVMVEIAVDQAAPAKVLIKDVQHHPLTGRILHIDLQTVSMTERLRVTVPIELVGEPVGVLTFGGVLESLVREVEIECLPDDIPNALELDVSELDLGDTLTMGDIKLDAGKATLASDPEIAVAHVSAPRVADEEDDEEGEEGEEGVAGAEPEVITEKKEEGEG